MHEEWVDLPRVIEALESNGLQYVLVGGLAVVLHGGARTTKDADIAIGFTIENRRLAAEALAPLNPRPMRLAEGAAWVWDEKCIRPPWSIYRTDAGRVDILVDLPGIASFDVLYENANIFELEGRRARVASIEDLLLMKETAGRPVDIADCQVLRAILEMRQ